MTNQELGRWGEDKAAAYLLKHKYEILEINWRFSKAEIDIIAKKNNVLIFVEVKTRTNDYLGAPEASVTPAKENLMYDAAGIYMEKVKHDWEIRFDIISILYKENITFTLTHFKDAFYPEIGL